MIFPFERPEKSTCRVVFFHFLQGPQIHRCPIHWCLFYSSQFLGSIYIYWCLYDMFIYSFICLFVYLFTYLFVYSLSKIFFSSQQTVVSFQVGFELMLFLLQRWQLPSLKPTAKAPENRRSEEKINLPTIDFQGRKCQFQWVHLLELCYKKKSRLEIFSPGVCSIYWSELVPFFTGVLNPVTGHIVG